MTESVVVKMKKSDNNHEYDDGNVASKKEEKRTITTSDNSTKEKIFSSVTYKNGVVKKTLVAVVKDGKTIFDKRNNKK